MDEWQPCRFDKAERGYVEWVHFDVDAETLTCFHHARKFGATMVANGWARVTEDEWLTEPSRLTGAL